MESQFASEPLPEWADGLPQAVISAVRREAIRRGIPSKDLVKEWTLNAARSLSGIEPGTPASRTPFEGLPPAASVDLPV